MRTHQTSISRLCVCTALSLVLGGCDIPSVDLLDSVVLTNGEYALLDLSTGEISYVDTAPSMGTRQLNQIMVFKYVSPGIHPVGASSSALGSSLDATVDSRPHDGFFLAVAETTQAQWLALGGSAGWSTTGVDAVTGSAVGDTVPAYHLSQADVTAVLSSYQASKQVSLRMPSAAEWEIAARAASDNRMWSWGDAQDLTTVSSHAIVAESAAAVDGARTAAGRSANAWGFYDMHGNVSEWVSDGHLRGGSWLDNLACTRCSHAIAADPNEAHPLAGVRLVLVPPAE